jgi:hypothetical protein
MGGLKAPLMADSETYSGAVARRDGPLAFGDVKHEWFLDENMFPGRA